MLRDRQAGSLRADDIGTEVVLAGWVSRRRDHGGVAFIDLRDASGTAQVVIHDEAVARELRPESCIGVTGTVVARPAGNENPDVATGEIEVESSAVEVYSLAQPLPFGIDDYSEVGEEARLRWRYLDLRRTEPTRVLRMRSEVNRVARTVLADEGFVEVETPTLTRSTPEGARDFLVPARLRPGSWYALPQSPQLFKQLLMVAGLEKYYQIARCYRDEDFRADRQPEFTQLDVEMSFVEQDDVIAVAEKVIGAIWKTVLGVDIGPIAHLTYNDAMRRFGTDKPDLRFDLELTELTEAFAATEFRVFQVPYVGAVVMPGGASQPRRTLDGWQEWARQRGARGLAYVLVSETGELAGPVAKNLSDREKREVVERTGAARGDCIFFAAGTPADARALLGAARVEIATRLGLIPVAGSGGPEREWSFVWVVDAPMFEPINTDGSDGGWTSVHHPFTSPRPEWLATFADNPGEALASAYDLVCNGNEIGGGSIRIHRADIQQQVFALLGMSTEDAESKFGFLLDAFQYGPPPHGGIAFGWDRICMLLADTESLRDVIAFPKTGGGFDPLTAAPAPISAQQRQEAGIDVIPETGGEA